VVVEYVKCRKNIADITCGCFGYVMFWVGLGLGLGADLGSGFGLV